MGPVVYGYFPGIVVDCMGPSMVDKVGMKGAQWNIHGNLAQIKHFNDFKFRRHNRFACNLLKRHQGGKLTEKQATATKIKKTCKMVVNMLPCLVKRLVIPNLIVTAGELMIVGNRVVMVSHAVWKKC